MLFYGFTVKMSNSAHPNTESSFTVEFAVNFINLIFCGLKRTVCKRA